MSVSPADAVRQLRERFEHRPQSDLAAEAAAKSLLPALVHRLRREGAMRIVLFGSLADGYFREESDIDLAVSGLSERVLAQLERELTILARRSVELVNLDVAPEPLRESIQRSGQELS